ncbi:hypothetical protein VKT23_001586 [Stygiomarasmius scandens]|uniref:F-box domain-containing protein n=1 Tax=Marasmiellus scandens TaxID=2682957 RepID=A0ABR1K5K6_9AGAR
MSYCMMDAESPYLKTTLCSRCNAEFLAIERVAEPSIKKKLRTTMYLPSETETAQLFTIVRDCQQDLGRYDSEINFLTKALDRLKDQRQRLQRFTDEHRTLISVVRRLPNELLSEIFALACADSLVVSRKQIFAQTLKISQVCSNWRKAVHSLPKLWSSLIVNLTNDRKGVNELVDLYLERSHGLPLTLKILARSTWFLEDEEYTSDWPERLSSQSWSIFSTMLEFSQRWRNVSIEMHWDLMDHVMEKVPILSEGEGLYFDQLQQLEIKWEPYSYHYERSNHLIDTLGLLGDLRSLRIDMYHDSFFSLDPEAMADVKTLVVRKSIFESNVVPLFKCFPHVENLELTCVFDEEFGPPISGLPDLPQIICRLKHLTLWIGPSLPASHLVAALTLPCLTHLCLRGEIEDQDQHGSTWVNNLKTMLSQSPHLQNLELVGKPFQADTHMTEILSIIPHLTHLKIDVSPSEKPHFQLQVAPLSKPKESSATRILGALTLEPLNANSYILPRLTHLDIEFEELARSADKSSLLDPVVALAMTQSRRRNVPRGCVPLEHIHFVGWFVNSQSAKLFDTVLPDFLCLRESGLDFKLDCF